MATIPTSGEQGKMTFTKVHGHNIITVDFPVRKEGKGEGVAPPPVRREGKGERVAPPPVRRDSDDDKFSDLYESCEEEEVSGEEEETYTLESPIIKAELDRIFAEIHKKGDTVIWRLPKTLIIHFVDTLEQAHDYLKLEKYLEECPFMKPLCPVERICKLLEKDIKERFNKVNPSIVPDAVEARLWLLEAELEIETKYQCMIYLRKFDYEETYKPDTLEEIQAQFPNLDSSEISDGLQWYRLYLLICDEQFIFPKDDEASYIKLMDERRQLRLQLLRNQENKMAVPLSPIYALASRAYKEGYVMNQNPEMEVRKIRRYDEWLNFLYLKDGPLENLLYQARTVMVSNVSLNASTQDINNLLSSFGGIEDIKIERGRKFKTAHVTFKDFEGTEAALRLQDSELHDIPVVITPSIADTPRLHLIAATSLSCAVEKAEDIRNRYNAALEKYKTLRLALPNKFEQSGCPGSSHI